MTFTRFKRSNASGFRTSIPFSALLPTPVTMLRGVARPSAHGHATTSTEAMCMMALLRGTPM